MRTFLIATRELCRRNPDVTLGELGGDIESSVRAFGDHLDAALRIGGLETRFESPWPREVRGLFAADNAAALGSLLAWCTLEALGRVSDPSNPLDAAARLFEALRLRDVVAEAASRLGLAAEECWASGGTRASRSLTHGRLRRRRRGRAVRQHSAGSTMPTPRG